MLYSNSLPIIYLAWDGPKTAHSMKRSCTTTKMGSSLAIASVFRIAKTSTLCTCSDESTYGSFIIKMGFIVEELRKVRRYLFGSPLSCFQKDSPC
jgi:hypothetical protein